MTGDAEKKKCAEYYTGAKERWEADAKAELYAPIDELLLVMGQTSLDRGSWALLVEEQQNYKARIVGDLLFVGLTPVRLSELWGLPDGMTMIGAIVNNGTRGQRFFINRNSKP